MKLIAEGVSGNPIEHEIATLERAEEISPASVGLTINEPCKELVFGLDGGYVRNRHGRPERNFEVVAGKVLDHEGQATRFAVVRNGGSEATRAVNLALRQRGVTETTSITVLADGDAGLRAIQRQAAPHAEHVLDWFHIAMRFTNLQQLAKGISGIRDSGIRSHVLAEIDLAKWRLWNGYAERGVLGLVHLRQWAGAYGFHNIPSLRNWRTRCWR